MCDGLSQAEIWQTYVTILINQDIFWFQMSKNNIVSMQIADSQGNLGADKLNFRLIKPFVFVNMHA